MARRASVPSELTRGPFTVAEAERAGLTRRQLEGRSWRRLGAGLYAWAELPDGPALVLAAISRRLPEGAAFSGRTAAWLHGLDLPPCEPVEVTVSEACGISTRAGARVRRAALPAGDVVMQRGMPATSPLRTIGDLGASLPLVEGVVVADMALQHRLVDEAALRAYAAAPVRHKGSARLRRVVDLADRGAESAMETRLRMLLVLAGLPRPQTQTALRDDGGRFLGRPDLYYPAQRLALEYDGRTHRESLAEDERRQNRLVSAGYRLLRFTATDVLRTPDALVAQVRAVLVL